MGLHAPNPFKKPARDLLIALSAGSILSSSNNRTSEWASITHREPFRVRGVNFGLVTLLVRGGYIRRIENTGIAVHSFSYQLTDAGRAAVESFNAPQEQA
jgi:hypothetical protein